MEKQLQKLDENDNKTTIIAQKALFKENKRFFWKTGIQALVTAGTLVSLIITGAGIIPISIFSGSIITGNILSIWAEKKERKI